MENEWFDLEALMNSSNQPLVLRPRGQPILEARKFGSIPTSSDLFYAQKQVQSYHLEGLLERDFHSQNKYFLAVVKWLPVGRNLGIPSTQSSEVRQADGKLDDKIERGCDLDFGVVETTRSAEVTRLDVDSMCIQNKRSASNQNMSK